MPAVNVSVCMATFNGQAFIRSQIQSIVDQLDRNDELVISDDGSTDSTLEIVGSFYDCRVKVYHNKGRSGPVGNFENAIKNSICPVIVLSDQDDIWDSNKLNYIRSCFSVSSCSPRVFQFNGCCIDKNGLLVQDDLFAYLKFHSGFFNTIVRNTFIGCNMAFDRSLLSVLLPFPSKIPMHDSWIACCGYMFGQVYCHTRKVFHYRLHDNNFTKRKSSNFQKVMWRIILIKSLSVRWLTSFWRKLS